MITKELVRLIESENGVELSSSQMLNYGTGKGRIEKTMFDVSAVVIDHECGTIELQIPTNEKLASEVEKLPTCRFIDNSEGETSDTTAYKADMEGYFGIVFLRQKVCHVQVSKKQAA